MLLTYLGCFTVLSAGLTAGAVTYRGCSVCGGGECELVAEATAAMAFFGVSFGLCLLLELACLPSAAAVTVNLILEIEIYKLGWVYKGLIRAKALFASICLIMAIVALANGEEIKASGLVVFLFTTAAFIRNLLQASIWASPAYDNMPLLASEDDAVLQVSILDSSTSIMQHLMKIALLSEATFSTLKGLPKALNQHSAAVVDTELAYTSGSPMPVVVPATGAAGGENSNKKTALSRTANAGLLRSLSLQQYRALKTVLR
jgi:hypothetical protein